ncbi:hypothetical protein L1286_16760 [Pseudoalteromonas sp. SMS1]|uniref:hypothetical protein n=1 Tax=Pseudoalteromonas sp. SMS1 TaxID=2908894 RepID=UPI001F3AE468|nr:hypothetical protein [Pseudoalteromonas sp. SMS1]MCF2859136.1 hypothetical protein [Pseudoalteromonas sp. SMS1]
MNIKLTLIALIYFSAGFAVSSIFLASSEPLETHYACLSHPLDSHKAKQASDIYAACNAKLSAPKSVGSISIALPSDDDHIYEQVLYADHVGEVIEQIQAHQIAQNVQAEQALFERIKRTNVGDIETISEVLTAMIELELSIVEPQIVSHLLETVHLAEPNHKAEMAQVLSVLHGRVTADSIPSLLRIIESHSEFNPMVAWQAMSLLAKTSRVDDIRPYFDMLSRSAYTAVIMEGAQAWLDSNGTLNFNDAKYFEQFVEPYEGI